MSACGAASPASSSAPSASSAGSAWNDVVAAAQREGSVKVIGQAGDNIAQVLAAGFKQRYPQINVDFNGIGSGAMETKVLTERQAGQFTYDVAVHGPPDLLNLMEAKALDPLPPILTGPNTSDLTKWLDGTFDYADTAGQYVFMFFSGSSTPLIYDPRQASPSDFTSWRDLLNPKWKGKIAMYDPRIPGNAQGMTQFW
ncbi:MAG TPA: extracellular solute-binding protein, partial [Chloroflexota bacterium]|nr:extracellular solute-binding protein [Chloroflexota bacterium]